MRKKYFSLYKRLLCLFFITVLPMQFGYLYMYGYSSGIIRKQINSDADGNVTYLRDEVQSMIDSLNMQMEYLLNTPEVVSLYARRSVLEKHTFYAEVIRIQNVLRLLVNQNRYISGFDVHYLGMDYVVSSKTARQEWAEDMLPGVESFRRQGMLLAYREEKYVVGHMFPSRCYLDDSVPLYYAEAELAESELRALLSSFSDFSGNNMLMLKCDTKTMLTSVNCLTLSHQMEDMLFDVLPTETTDVPVHTNLTIGRDQYIAISCYAPTARCIFVQLIPKSMLHAVPDRFFRYMVAFMFFSSVLMLVFIFGIRGQVKRPMAELIGVFQRVGAGDFSAKASEAYPNEYGILANGLNIMISRVDALIDRDYHQTILMQNADLKQLQAQINPHFLYNCFFFIQNSLDCGDVDVASEFLQYLAQYYRYIAHDSDDTATMAEEYRHAMDYLAIQAMRMDSMLRTEIAPLPETWREVRVPRLLLLPLFENVLEHGIRTDEEQGCLLLRFVELDANTLMISVDDNGNSLTDETVQRLNREFRESKGMRFTSGLVNIHRRLGLYYHDECGLLVSRGSLGGFHVEMTIHREGGIL